MDELVLVEESFGDDIPLGSCGLCSSEISIPYYTEREVAYGYDRSYFHKECFDMPEEMEHQQHPGHTLLLCDARYRVARGCSVCDELDRGSFSYRCSDCSDFTLDMVCALKSFPITHISHPNHQLIPIHDKASEKFLCPVCKIVDNGISYKCLTCPFRVHQNCVCPMTIKRPYHRHALKLIYSIPRNRSVRSIYCQICQQDFQEQSFAYNCARCGYFIHTYDCSPFVHFSHEHPLFLVEEEEDDDKEANAYSAFRKCHGCGLKISVPYYACNNTQCTTFFLHKTCANLPQNLENRMHLGHTLTLLSEEYSGRMCKICLEPWSHFKYYCAHPSCDFYVDILCAMKMMYSKHEFHHHPLISSHTKGSFHCHACKIDTGGASYQCTTCRFWVHQKCASLLVSKKFDLHPHKLKLTYSLSESHPSRKHFRCHACREDMEPNSWAYHCRGCKFFTHVHNCVDLFREIEGFDHEKALEAAAHLPVANEFVSLATLFFMDADEEEDNDVEPLTHDGRGIKTRESPFIDPITTNCESDQFQGAPCNRCDPCKCLLRKSPAELQDPSVAKASDKGKNCGGFFITRPEDRLHLYVSTAVLPCYVKHEGHIHALSTTKLLMPTWCNACEVDFTGYGFRCKICKFTLDPYCAMLPGSVSHHYDKEHGFKLIYYSIKDVEEYVCEICEGDINTMWFYHSAESDQSIHPKCIWKNYIKYLGADNPMEWTNAVVDAISGSMFYGRRQ